MRSDPDSARRTPRSRRDARLRADRVARQHARPGSSRTGAPRRDGRDSLQPSLGASQQRAQLARGSEQVDTHRRFVQPRHRADFLRRAVAVLAQHKNRPLPSVETIDGRGHARASFARQKRAFGIARNGCGCRDARFVGRRDIALDEPAVAPCARLATVQAAIDENPRKPDLERPGLAICADMAKYLDERVLDGLVGLGRVAEILICNARCAALMVGNELAETLSRLVHLAPLNQLANLDGDASVFTDRRRLSADPPTRLPNPVCGRTFRPPSGVFGCTVRYCPQVSTHRKLRFARAGVYSLL